MNIAGLIEAFYKRSAQRICGQLYETTSNECEGAVVSAWRKYLLNIVLKEDVSIAAISHDFYDTLDKAESYLVTDTEKPNISFYDYYKDSNTPDWNTIVHTIISSNEQSFMKCKDNDKNRDSVVEKIQKRLEQKISIEYIATLLYYKLNHRYYDKTIILTFREIIRECTDKETSNTFTKEFSNAIRKICQEVADKSADEVYDSLFEKENLNNKYKPNHDEFRRSLNHYSLCCLTNKKHKNYPIQAWYMRLPYYNKVKEKIQNDSGTAFFCSVEEAYNDFSLNKEDVLMNHPKKVDKLRLSENEYRQLLTKYLPLLAGINPDQITSYVQKIFRKKCLLKSMIDDINRTVSITFRLCEQIYKPRKKRTNTNQKTRRGTKYEFSSRFEMIHSLGDLLDMDMVINNFFMIFFGILDKDSYVQFISDYKGKMNIQAVDELKAIHSAAEETNKNRYLFSD